MSIFKLKVNNSYSELSGSVPPHILENVKALLTYKNDISGELAQLFNQIKFHKSRGNEGMAKKISAKIKFLKDTEYVCWLRNNQFPTGLLNMVIDLLDAIAKNQYELVDQRDKPESYHIFNWKNKPPELRYYQKEMVELGLKENRGVFESAVGTGKSLIMMNLIQKIGVNSLIILPSAGLVEQLYNDLRIYFGINKVQKVTTKQVRDGKNLKPIRLMTIQSLASLQKSNELSHLVCDIDALFVDEIHHAGSKSYTDLLHEISHIYYRFGFTGTFLRNDSKSLDMWGFLSNKLYSYKASKAIQEGYLTPTKLKIWDVKGKRHQNYQKEYTANYCGNPEMLGIIQEILLNNSEDQILILVKQKDKSGKIIHEFLNTLNIDNRYISGDDKKEDISSTISDFNDKKFNVLIGSSVIGEGIDVRSTDHLIMAQGGKSEIVIVQAVGRCVRLFEGKKEAFIHDFNFIGTKYMKKHLLQRLNVYENNFEPEIINEK